MKINMFEEGALVVCKAPGEWQALSLTQSKWLKIHGVEDHSPKKFLMPWPMFPIAC
jgi:hypothetical protein